MANHNIDLGYRPREWQSKIHRELSHKRFAICIVHRRAGKSVAAKMELIDRALTKNGFEGGYIAPFLSQARRVMWTQLRDLANKIPHTEVRETEMLITFPNKSTIRCLGADSADGIRGLGFDYVVGDELADWDPLVLPQVVMPTLAGRNGGLFLIGTPKGIDTLTNLYIQHQDDPDWYTCKMSVYDTGALSQQEIDIQKGLMLPQLFDLEFGCNFDVGSERSLITADEVKAAFQRKVLPYECSEHATILGVDVARFGDDRTVIYRRQGPKAYVPTTLRGCNTIEIAREVSIQYHQYNVDAVFLDYSAGLGGGVEDQLNQLGVNPVCVHFNGKPQNDRFLNCRAEMWFNMVKWVRMSGSLEQSRSLLLELTAARYDFKDGKVKLESKDDMKKRGLPSPDEADALALTFYLPVNKNKRFNLKDHKTPDWNIYDGI